MRQRTSGLPLIRLEGVDTALIAISARLDVETLRDAKLKARITFQGQRIFECGLLQFYSSFVGL